MNAYTIIAAEFSLLFLLYFFSGASKSRVSFALVLYAFAIFAQVSLVQIRLGPVSIRIYLALLLALIVVSSPPAQRNVKRIINRHRSLFIAFILFYFWVIFSDVLSGRMVDSGLVSYFRDFLSNYVAAVLIFVAGIGLMRKKEDLVYVGKSVIAIAFVSVIFAVGQYLNFSFTTRVYETLYPYELENRILEGTYGRNHVSGLSQYSIPFIYTLLTCLPLAFSFALLAPKKEGSIRSAFVLGIFFLGAVATVLARSRSGLLGFGLSFFLITIFAPRIFKGIKTKNYLRIGLAAMFLLLAVFIVRESSSKSYETKYQDFTRMEQLWDKKRVNFGLATLSESVKHPVLGMGGGEFTKRYGNVPHNTFLNAMIYFGTPALLFSLFYHFYFFQVAVSDLKNIQLREWSWVTIGSFIGLFNFLWNGMTHNESFVLGGVYGFIILALYFASRELSHKSAAQQQGRVLYTQPPFPSASPSGGNRVRQPVRKFRFDLSE